VLAAETKERKTDPKNKESMDTVAKRILGVLFLLAMSRVAKPLYKYAFNIAAFTAGVVSPMSVSE